MTKQLIVLLVCFLGLQPTGLFAQVSGGNTTLNLQDMRGLGEVFNISQREAGNRFGLDFRSAGVDGSPFLFDETHKAKLVMKTGDTLAQSVDANIDFAENEVYVGMESGEGGFIKAGSLQKVLFTEPEYQAVYVSLADPYVRQDRDPVYRLYELLYEGDYQLLKYNRRKLIKSNKNSSYSATGSLNDKYVEEEDYYFCKTGERCEKIRLRGKDVVKTLEDWGESTTGLTKSDERARTEAELVNLIGKLRK
jgi:hypothetical protein